ncbi:GroES-like protein [Agrocybe pediades]|nr:GroES-like protein [Agrocybe pediades]
MPPATQKAFQLHEDWTFKLDEIPVPSPGKGQILVKVQSVGLNPADWKIPRFKVMVERFPAVIGSDIAGDVAAVGEDVDDFKVGDRVFHMSDDWQNQGAFQNYVLVHHARVAKIPSNITYDEAATLPLAVSTAVSGLYAALPHGIALTPPTSAEGYGKYAGNAILVLGGASAVGQATIQFARLSGFSPIFTTASLKNTEALKKLGATHVLSRDLSSSEVIAEISKITSKPVEYVYDAVVYEDTQKLAVDVVAQSPKGGLIALATPQAVVTAPNDNVKIATIFAGNLPYNLELFEAVYHDHLSEWVEKGLILPNRLEVLPGGLKGIESGLERLEADQVSRLKLIIRPQETV